MIGISKLQLWSWVYYMKYLEPSLISCQWVKENVRQKYFELLTNLRSRIGRIETADMIPFFRTVYLHLNSLFRPCYILPCSLVIIATDDQGPSPSPMEDLWPVSDKGARSKDPSLRKTRQTKTLAFPLSNILFFCPNILFYFYFFIKNSSEVPVHDRTTKRFKLGFAKFSWTWR